MKGGALPDEPAGAGSVAGVVVVPLAMTVLLSFHDWGSTRVSSRSSS